MKITAHIVQFPISLTIADNLRVIDSTLANTKPGDLVLFPEGCVSGYSTDTGFLKQINLDELSAALKHIKAEAERLKINTWVGACTRQEGRWYNSAYGFCADGQTHLYHKVNLANHERGVFSAGSELPVFELDMPAGRLVVGVQLCRELRYPEQWGWLARSGAQVILHLNNAVGDDHFQPVWKSHLISRAAETQRFILSANNAAEKQICPSMAVGPDGHILAEVVSASLETLHLELDLARVSNWYLDQCRSDIIAIQRATGAAERNPEHTGLENMGR